MPRKHHNFTAIFSRLSFSRLILFSCKGEVHHHVSGNQLAQKEATRVSQDELTVALQWQNARWHEVILARLTSGARAVCCRCEMSQVNTMPCLLILCSWLSSPECSFTPSLGSLYRAAMNSLRWQLSVCHAWCRAGLRWETIDADQSNEQALEWTVSWNSWKFDRNPESIKQVHPFKRAWKYPQESGSCWREGNKVGAEVCCENEASIFIAFDRVSD